MRRPTTRDDKRGSKPARTAPCLPESRAVEAALMPPDAVKGLAKHMTPEERAYFAAGFPFVWERFDPIPAKPMRWNAGRRKSSAPTES